MFIEMLHFRTMLEPLMDHRELLEGDESKGRVVKFLVARNHEEGMVWRCLGLPQTNGVTSHSTQGVATGHGLCPVFSITNHSCISNTRHATVDDSFCLLAVVDIKKGEEIFASYIRLAEPLLRQFQKDAHSRLFQLLHVLPDQEEDSVRGLVLLLLLSPVLRPHGAGHSVQHTQVAVLYMQ